MIYSVDTCVLLDVLLPDPIHGIRSRETLKKASENGSLAICSIVYTELCPQFDARTSLDVFLNETGINVLPFTREILWKAGMEWKGYLKRGGQGKDRIIPDFLIGSFSFVKAEAIITRDKSFYKEYFQLDVYYD
ncbi:MAG: type II toxin-antitoxin system VapC family toxin [Deltaproteobacteria bacterium]